MRSKSNTGELPKFKYVINNTEREDIYFLVDGIYPRWNCFVSSFTNPADAKQKHFASCQEASRKDVERAFGVLQARFAILRMPSRLLSLPRMHDIMLTCIILHNMIQEDEGFLDTVETMRRVSTLHQNAGDTMELLMAPPIQERTLALLLKNMRLVKNSDESGKLKNDLIEHLWSLHGQQ